MSKYWNKSYHSSVVDGSDALTLRKTSGSDWSHITMNVHGEFTSIDVRSRDQLEQLGLMIAQCLRED